jgi:hypothetical protein
MGERDEQICGKENTAKCQLYNLSGGYMSILCTVLHLFRVFEIFLKKMLRSRQESESGVNLEYK